MSKRYGRNQKRRDREEIARLRQELDVAITGGFALARPTDVKLDEFVGSFVSIDINDREDGFTIRRTATIRFIPAYERKRTRSLVYHVAYSGLIAWRGVRWIVRIPHAVDPANAFQDFEIMELELEALGERDDRRPATFRPLYDIKRHHRRIAA